MKKVIARFSELSKGRKINNDSNTKSTEANSTTSPFHP